MKYGGSWAKGFAKTFDPLGGINLGLQWKERKEAKKKIDDAVEKLKLDSLTLAAKYDSDRVDGSITQQEYSDALAWALTAGDEIMGRVEKLYGNYRQFTKEEVDKELGEIDSFYKLSADLDFTNIEEMKSFGSNLTQEKAITKWNLIIKSIEGRGKPIQPEAFRTAEEARAAYPGAKIRYTKEGYVAEFAEPGVPEMPGITDYNSAANYLSKFKDAPAETFNKIKAGFQSKFPNIDMSSITQESLREPEKPTPEGEITAGEKRTYDMASSIMFGSSDWVTGISKPGIISTMISNKLNMGQPLTDEEKAEVRNNYNTIKETLPSEVISAVESQLKRYGIPLVEPTPTITPTPTPEPEPKKWWEFWKEGTKTVTPEVTPEVTPGITPTAGEIPTPKVPVAGKEALIPTMTKKELEDAIRGLDPSDPLYKLIYDEAVKRGYITK